MSKKLGNDNVAMFDVDGTLVDWDVSDESKAISINNNGMAEKVQPLDKTILRLKQHKLTGASVVVWSQSGEDWAEAVCKALEIDGYVDFYMTKPKLCYDDSKFDNWTLIVNLNDKADNE